MRRLSIAVTILGGLCTAQTTYTAHPIDNTASGTSQNIPFAGNSTSWDEARSQFLIPAAFLPATGGLVTAIELVPNTSYTNFYERFEIYMDLTMNPTLSTTFANNLTNPVQVFAQSPGTISWVGATWTTIQLTTPFVVDGVQNLVIEFRKKMDRPNNPPTASVSHRILTYPRRVDLPPPIWAYGAYGSGAVDAATATSTYSTQVLMRLQWAGMHTLAIDSTRDVTGNANRGYFHLGATATVTTQGMPGEFHLDLIGLALQPMGVPIPPVGGFFWLPGVTMFGSGILDPAGLGSASLLIPSNTSLIGIRFYCQTLTAGTALTLTNVVDGVITVY